MIKRAILAALAALLVFVMTPAGAAPKAGHPGECRWLWDIALTARAAAMEGVPRETVRRVVWRIYGFAPAVPAEDKTRLRELGNAVVDAAGSAARPQAETAGDFAGELRTMCLDRDGDMDEILGMGL